MKKITALILLSLLLSTSLHSSNEITGNNQLIESIKNLPGDQKRIFLEILYRTIDQMALADLNFSGQSPDIKEIFDNESIEIEISKNKLNEKNRKLLERLTESAIAKKIAPLTFSNLYEIVEKLTTTYPYL